jgi:hypothetical protein
LKTATEDKELLTDSHHENLSWPCHVDHSFSVFEHLYHHLFLSLRCGLFDKSVANHELLVSQSGRNDQAYPAFRVCTRMYDTVHIHYTPHKNISISTGRCPRRSRQLTVQVIHLEAIRIRRSIVDRRYSRFTVEPLLLYRFILDYLLDCKDNREEICISARLSFGMRC